MTASYYAMQAIPFALALALGIVFPLSLVGTSMLTRRWSMSIRLSLILILMIVGSTLSVALSGRVLISEVMLAAQPGLGLVATDPSPWGSLASQVCSLLILLIAGAECFGWLLRSNSMAGAVRYLWTFMIIYFLLSIVISGLFGIFRNPRLNDLYAPIVLTAIALLAKGADLPMWRRVRWALLLPTLGSLIAAIAAPKLALLADFGQTIIPGLSQRLYGVADHANALGIVAAIALILELSPIVRTRPVWLLVCCQLLVLILTQSKTAWVAALLAIIFVRRIWLRDTVFSGNKQSFFMASIVALCLLTSILTLGIFFGTGSSRLVYFLDGIGAFNLTGRTRIWQITIDEFFRSPFTGYGPSLWDLQYRTERGMLYVGQAHNQFVQTLGQAGIFGLVAILGYLGVMFSFAVNRTSVDKGLALVLFLMLVVRCFSESPMRMSGVIGWDEFLHALTFTAIAALAAASTSIKNGAQGATRNYGWAVRRL
jgi:exopolysaccharide production protein ExoQ